MAELAAFVTTLGVLKTSPDHPEETCFFFDTENEELLRKCFTYLKKTTNIGGYEKNLSPQETQGLLKMLKFKNGNLDTVDGLLLQQPCCKRSFLRGVFLAAGSLSDPRKGYHFELVARSSEQAKQWQSLISVFDISAKTVERKGHYVVYLKEGSQISDMLNVIEAHVSLMDFENIRIYKDMRNYYNRQVNCEAANIAKTVSAAVRQVNDIRFIEEQIGLSSLPESLQEIAEVRLENSDMPLQELGQLLHPPIGKSGVNHRLRRISEIAEKLRT